MKRILIILLALLITHQGEKTHYFSGGSVNSTPIVYAATEETKTTTVNLEVTQSYTWTVPTNIVFTENGQMITENISVSENIIPKNTKLCIKLSSDQAFVLNNTGGSDTRSFAIKKDGTNLNAGDTVLEVNAGTQTGNQSLDFVLDNADVTYSGNYTNTVTFVADVEKKKIYLINESPLSTAGYFYYDISFITNNIKCTRLKIGKDGPAGTSIAYYSSETDTWYPAYNNKVWTDEVYRTIEFLEEPSGDLHTWLENNATKQY